MVLEFLRPSSEGKHLATLKQAYEEAGVCESWVVDARWLWVDLDIYRHTARGYVRTPKRDGWVRSRVFDRAFRLVVRNGQNGLLNYSLEVK
jgi:Uma2 family endonuclease